MAETHLQSIAELLPLARWLSSMLNEHSRKFSINLGATTSIRGSISRNNILHNICHRQLHSYYGGRDIRRCRCTDPLLELRDAGICARCGLSRKHFAQSSQMQPDAIRPRASFEVSAMSTGLLSTRMVVWASRSHLTSKRKAGTCRAFLR